MGQGNMTLGIFTNNIDNRLFGHTVEWKVKKKKSDRTVEKHKKKQEYRNYTLQQFVRTYTCRYTNLDYILTKSQFCLGNL